VTFLRGLLLDNLGLKLVALLLALVVYLHVFTERPATMVIAFPIQITDLADSLSLSGSVPEVVEAELEGTGKQFIRLWLTEPRLKISLAGVGPGHMRRIVTEGDLPLIASDQITIHRLIGPDTLELRIERKLAREIAVAPRVEGHPRADATWTGEALATPSAVMVRGPRQAVATLDSVRLESVVIEGKRDSVRAQVGAAELPEWCVIEPAIVTVTVPLRRTRL
jgi:hypothetical protein